tara:strand:+ start:2963 stop:3859 length:897 start_codon:yes stop_codon:yes gene_type:complete
LKELIGCPLLFTDDTQQLARVVRALASNFVNCLPSKQVSFEQIKVSNQPEALKSFSHKGHPEAIRLTLDERAITLDPDPSVCLLTELLLQEFEPAMGAKDVLVRRESGFLQLILIDPSSLFKMLSMRRVFNHISLIPTRGIISLDSLSLHLKEGRHPLMLSTIRNNLHGYKEIDPYVSCLHDIAHALRFSDQGFDVHQAHYEIFEVVRLLCDSRGSLYGMNSKQISLLLETILSGPRLSRSGDIYKWLGRDICRLLFLQRKTAFLLELIRLTASIHDTYWSARLSQGFTAAIVEYRNC